MGGGPGQDQGDAVRRGEALARLILDTSALVSVERDGLRWDELVAADDDVAIAAITAAELLAGVELADNVHRAGRAAFVERALSILPLEAYDLAAARAHATLLAHVRRAGRMRGAHDLMIAATAASSARTVVSRDATAFDELPGVSVRLVRNHYCATRAENVLLGAVPRITIR